MILKLFSIDLLIDFILSFFNMIKLLLNNIINVKKYKTINFIKKKLFKNLTLLGTNFLFLTHIYYFTYHYIYIFN